MTPRAETPTRNGVGIRLARFDAGIDADMGADMGADRANPPEAPGGSGFDARTGGRVARGSLTVVSKMVVPDRMPENRPAQPRQYLAPFRLGMWQESQNLVMGGRSKAPGW